MANFIRTSPPRPHRRPYQKTKRELLNFRASHMRQTVNLNMESQPNTMLPIVSRHPLAQSEEMYHINRSIRHRWSLSAGRITCCRMTALSTHLVIYTACILPRHLLVSREQIGNIVYGIPSLQYTCISVRNMLPDYVSGWLTDDCSEQRILRFQSS